MGIGAYTFVYARGASYLTNDPAACVNCHVMREPYDGWRLRGRALTIQQRTFELRNRAMNALTALIADLGRAAAARRPEAELARARDFQRRAQFYLDFVEAENSTGFHAPQEAARILAESIDFARQGQVTLRELRPR